MPLSPPERRMVLGGCSIRPDPGYRQRVEDDGDREAGQARVHRLFRYAAVASGVLVFCIFFGVFASG